MRKGLLAAMLLTILGCSGDEEEEPEPPPPTIRVERQEDTNGVRISIWYDHHIRDYLGNHRYGVDHVSFYAKDEEALENYRRQLEFAITQIEEVQKRIKVHEPQTQ